MNNRETWLTELSRLIEPVFKGFTIHPYRLTCGWPVQGGLSVKRRVIGECHARESSKGGIHEIFISPTIADSIEVAGTVCHEMTHVAAGIDQGHKGKFLKVRKHIGLTKGGPRYAMPGPQLEDTLRGIVEKLGVYPHTPLTGRTKPVKPSTDVTLMCVCGCRVRMTLKWFTTAGIPRCGCGENFLTPEDEP